MIVFVNGKEMRYINAERALKVAKEHGTVVFGLGLYNIIEVCVEPAFVQAIRRKI